MLAVNPGHFALAGSGSEPVGFGWVVFLVVAVVMGVMWWQEDRRMRRVRARLVEHSDRQHAELLAALRERA